MRLLAERVHWSNEDKDLRKIAMQCITCFRSGENLLTMVLENEVTHLPKFREIGEEIPIELVGRVLNKGSKSNS